MIRTTLHISPLFFGTAHHLLASRNPPVILPPLRPVVVLHAGAFAVEGGMRGDFVDTHERLILEAGAFQSLANLKEILWGWQEQMDIGPFCAASGLRVQTVRATCFLPVSAFAGAADFHPPGLCLIVPENRFTASAFLREPVIPGEHELPLLLKPFDAQSHLKSVPEREIWWQKEIPVTCQKIYTCTLTGDRDGLSDVELPMASFQYRLTEKGGSYLSVVLPHALRFNDLITARPKGRLVLRQGWRYADGSRQLTDMASAGSVRFRYDRGGRSGSLTLNAEGKITFSFDPNVAKVLDPVVAVSLQADGMTRFRCAPVMGLFPGDLAWVEGIPWRVARIAVSVNDKTQSMEVLAHG